MLAVPEETGQTAYYIINYEKGGFLILSADNRLAPVLAHSSTGTFDLNAEAYPSGLVDWLFVTSKKVEEVRRSNMRQSEAIARTWRECTMRQQMLRVTECDGSCVELEVHGPLLSTTWDQNCGYNDLMPTENDLGCSVDDEYCGKAPTGCVATAMAQVMKYYEYPSSYTWADMPNNMGTPATSQLMKDIGTAVDMEYGCGGSGAPALFIVSTFKNEFNYSSANKISYNYGYKSIKEEVKKNHPVILLGANQSGSWFFPVYPNGHAWVCDGYQTILDCESGITTSRLLHMNWGWGARFDSWYAYNNFSPGAHDFNYGKHIIYKFRP